MFSQLMCFLEIEIKEHNIEIASLLEWTFVYNDYLRSGHFFSVLLSYNRRSFAIFHLILPPP